MWTSRIAAGAALILTLTFLSLLGWGLHQRRQKEKVEATLTIKLAELEGAKVALSLKPKEIIKLVPQATTPAIAKAVKQGKIVPLAAVAAEVRSEPFVLPLPRSEGQPETGPTDDTPPTTGPVTFGVHTELLLTRVPRGPVMHEVSFSGTAYLEDFSVPITFEPGEADITVAVDKNIQKAFDFYDRSWLKKHTAFSCPSVGVTYNPLDTTRPVNVGITCSYGFVWF